MDRLTLTLAAVHFTSTVTLGTAVIGGLLVIIVGFFTFRANMAKTWEQNYEAEHVRRIQAENEAKEQRELKHELKTELAAANMKTDQTIVVEALRGMSEASGASTQMILATQERIAKTQERTNELLERLTDRIVGKVADVVQEKVDQLQANGETDKGGT